MPGLHLVGSKSDLPLAKVEPNSASSVTYLIGENPAGQVLGHE